MTFAPGSRLLAVAGGDRMLRFLDVETREEEISLPTPRAVHLVAIAADDLTMVMAGEKETEIWGRVEWHQPWRLLHADNQPARFACFTPSCDDLILLYRGQVLDIRRFSLLQRGGRVDRLWGQGHRFGSYRGTTSCAGRDSMAVAGFTLGHLPTSGPVDRALELLMAEHGGFTVGHLPTSGAPRSRGYLGRVRLHDGALLWMREIDGWLSCPRFSPDSWWVAGLSDSSIVLEPLQEHDTECRLDYAPRQAPSALAFSPDGHTLAVAAANGTIRLWPWRRLLVA
jgi:WD40 repeat protein